MDRFIYSQQFYNDYENLDSLINTLSAFNINDNKTIIWHFFNLSVISDISWKERTLSIRSVIDYVIIVLKHLNIYKKSTVDSTFKFTNSELLTEYNKRESSNTSHPALFVPLLSLKGYRIIGVCFYDLKPLELGLYNNYNFLAKLTKNTNGKINIVDNVTNNDDNKLEIQVDDGLTISMKFSKFFQCLKPYIPKLSVIIKNPRDTMKWKTTKALGVADLFDDHTYTL